MSAALLTTDRPIIQIREEHAAWLQERKSQFLQPRVFQPRRRKGLGEAVMAMMAVASATAGPAPGRSAAVRRSENGIGSNSIV